MWHSQLTPEYIDQLYMDKRYHEVIGHRNFNPRLIAFVLDSDKVAGQEPSSYWDYVCRTLENPHEVWSHFFSSQINQDCRDLVHITVLNGKSIREEMLREAFSHLPVRQNSSPALTHHEFQVALRHAVGSVLNRTLTARQGQAEYSLFNPSIADFVLRYLAGSNLWDYYYPSIRTLAALDRLQQMQHQDFFGPVVFRRVLKAIATAETKVEDRDGYSLRVASLLALESGLKEEFSDLLRFWIFSPVPEAIAWQVEDFIEVVLAWRGVVERSQMIERGDFVAETIQEAYLPYGDPELVGRLLTELWELGAETAYFTLRAELIEAWRENIKDIVKEEGVISEYFDHDEAGQAEGALEMMIRRKFSESGVDLAVDEVRGICRSLSIHEIIDENISVAAREDWHAESWREHSGARWDETAAVDDLFDRTDR